ncbi:MAG: cupin domain-containing protein [Ferruginibacter sp.]
MLSVKHLIEEYSLRPHPEGGWYKETYRSSEMLEAVSLPARFGGRRVMSTAIYFLLEQGNFSAFHRIKSDECWHFYAGDPLEVHMIRKDGTLDTILLGNDIKKGQLFQYVVPANCWFASRPATGSSFSFVGCTVAPGFDFADFELADTEALSVVYPAHKTLITSLTR